MLRPKFDTIGPPFSLTPPPSLYKSKTCNIKGPTSTTTHVGGWCVHPWKTAKEATSIPAFLASKTVMLHTSSKIGQSKQDALWYTDMNQHSVCPLPYTLITKWSWKSTNIWENRETFTKFCISNIVQQNKPCLSYCEATSRYLCKLIVSEYWADTPVSVLRIYHWSIFS